MASLRRPFFTAGLGSEAGVGLKGEADPAGAGRPLGGRVCGAGGGAGVSRDSLSSELAPVMRLSLTVPECGVILGVSLAWESSRASPGQDQNVTGGGGAAGGRIWILDGGP